MKLHRAARPALAQAGEPAKLAGQGKRPSAPKRGYDRKWQKARATFLRQRPWCEACGLPAEHVDHRVPHKGDPALFWSRANWQPLCPTCHNKWKQRAEVHGYDSRVGSDGLPIDPNHPFYTPRGAKSPTLGNVDRHGEPTSELVSPASNWPGSHEGASARPTAVGGIGPGGRQGVSVAVNPSVADFSFEGAF